MIKQILKGNAELLHKRMNSIDTESQITRMRKIHTDLIDTASAHPNCIGLAANQIGYNARMFIMKYGSEFILIVNPVITKEGRIKKKALEGCLSYPGKQVKVERYSQIVVNYINADGDVVQTKFSKLNARVFQHELDHLNGEVIV